jgi:hypothetical protein
LKDVPPLLPLESFSKKVEVIRSIQSQIEDKLAILRQNEADNRWICCKQDKFCYILKICNGAIEIDAVH